MVETVEAIAKPARPPASAWLKIARWLMAIVAWLIFLATLAGFAGRFWWGFGLFSPFRFQWLLIATVMMLILLIDHRRRRGPARPEMAAAMLSVIINAILVALLWMPAKQAPASGPMLTLMAANLYVGNHQLNQLATAKVIADAINHSDADLVLIQEITVHRLGILDRALPAYRKVAGTGRPDAFGIALLVKYSALAGTSQADLMIESAKEIELTGGLTSVKQIELRGRWQGRPFSLLGIHTISAVHARSDRYRTAMLGGAATWARQQKAEGRAIIICGDFNATPWCAPFVDLMKESQLLNSQHGFGYQGSWPSSMPMLLRIPIDHCIHSEEMVTISHEIGDKITGSDHLPLTVKLQWR